MYHSRHTLRPCHTVKAPMITAHRPKTVLIMVSEELAKLDDTLPPESLWYGPPMTGAIDFARQTMA
jgi:hypothetical protein